MRPGGALELLVHHILVAVVHVARRVAREHLRCSEPLRLGGERRRAQEQGGGLREQIGGERGLLGLAVAVGRLGLGLGELRQLGGHPGQG